MAKIKFCGLGGLDERGKNMYFIEVDSEIFILDAGFAIPDNEKLGINFIIPNISYLSLNKNRIKGIFISHGHDEQYGSLLYILKDLSDIPIYCSFVTKFIIETRFKRNNTELKNSIHVMEEEKKIKVGSIEVRAFLMTHSIPGTFAFVFSTSDGNILYLTDYMFDFEYKYQGLKPEFFNVIAKEKNLVMLSETSYAKLFNQPMQTFNLRKYLSMNKDKINSRLIVSLYEQDINQIMDVLEVAASLKKKVILYGLSAFTNIKYLMKSNILPKYDLLTPKDMKNKSLYKDMMIIFTGSPAKLFKKLTKVTTDDDPYLKLEEKDYFLNLAPPFAGNEKVAAETLNELIKLTRNLHSISQKEVKVMHPTQKDIEFFTSFIKPKYFIPIKSYYKDMLVARKVVLKTGIDFNNVLIAENGQFHLFENGEYKGVERKLTKEVGDVIVENVSNEEISLDILKEREALNANGAIILGIMIDRQKKMIIGQPDIQMKGVMFLRKNADIIDTIHEQIVTILKNNERNYHPKNFMVQLEAEVKKLIRKYLMKVPIVITNIIELNNN